MNPTATISASEGEVRTRSIPILPKTTRITNGYCNILAPKNATVNNLNVQLLQQLPATVMMIWVDQNYTATKLIYPKELPKSGFARPFSSSLPL